MDGVLQLAALADDLVHESFACDTRDHEDHTFCGIMFDVKCESALPLEYIELQSVSVRGDLGAVSVWRAAKSFRKEGHEAPLRGHERYYGGAATKGRALWSLVYEGSHRPSREAMVELRFNTPIRLESGESCGLYVHSAQQGDTGLVYDDQRSTVTYQDKCLKVTNLITYSLTVTYQDVPEGVQYDLWFPILPTPHMARAAGTATATLAKHL